MAIIPDGYGQANLFFEGTALVNTAEVTFGFANAADQSPLLCATAIRDQWISSMMENMVDDVTLVNVRVKLGPNDSGPIADAAASAAGGITDDPEPSQVSVLIKKVLSQGGRWNRGRMYIPGVPEEECDAGGILDTTYHSNWQTDADEFLLALVGLDVPMVLLHSTGPHSGDTPNVVDSLQVDTRIATQRRRLRR